MHLASLVASYGSIHACRYIYVAIHATQQTHEPLSPLSLGWRSLAVALLDLEGKILSRQVKRWRLQVWLVDVCWSLWPFLSEPMKGSLTLSSVLPSSLGLTKVYKYVLAKWLAIFQVIWDSLFWALLSPPPLWRTANPCWKTSIASWIDLLRLSDKNSIRFQVIRHFFTVLLHTTITQAAHTTVARARSDTIPVPVSLRTPEVGENQDSRN